MTIGGHIVRDYNDMPSNFRYTKTPPSFLRKNNIPGISGWTQESSREVSATRARDGCSSPTFPPPFEEGLKIISDTAVPHDAVEKVSCKKRWYSRTSNPKFNVVAVDCGIKLNIIRCLNKFGCNVTIVPSTPRPRKSSS